MPMVIVFDQVAYLPGSVVTGHVIIISKRPNKKVKGLSIRFHGGYKSRPKGHYTEGKKCEKTHFFDEKLDIFGHDGTDSCLNVGETLFPFRFNLPPGLPSSLIWSRGSILYVAEARLTKSASWKDDKLCSTRLAVEGVHDLNLDPLASLPASINQSKYVQQFLVKSGPLAFCFEMKRSGFIKGRHIPFRMEIKNLSKVNAKCVKVSLVQEIAQEGRTWSGIVEKLSGPSLPSGEIEVWDGKLKIPLGIPPTNLGNILNFPLPLTLNYHLHIELSVKSNSVEALTAKIPVTIGTIPFASSTIRSHQRLQQLGTFFLPHVHLHHEDGCPASGSSQFSTESLHHTNISRTNNVPCCNQCGRRRNYSTGINRRLRNLQRRRRESPPPSYEEVVNTISNNSEGTPNNPPQSSHNSTSIVDDNLKSMKDNNSEPIPSTSSTSQVKTAKNVSCLKIVVPGPTSEDDSSLSSFLV